MEDWDFNNAYALGLVAKRGRDLYRLGGWYVGKTDRANKMIEVQKIAPRASDNTIPVVTRSKFLSEAEIPVQKQLAEKFTKMYVLVKGTTDPKAQDVRYLQPAPGVLRI